MGAFTSGQDLASGGRRRIVRARRDRNGCSGAGGQEEAGCEVLALESIGSIILSPGGCSELIHLFCGRVDSRGLGGIHGLPEEGEDIKVIVLPREEALTLLVENQIYSANTVIALQWLTLNLDRLRAAWA